MDLSSLEPLCATSIKENVSMHDELTVLRKISVHVDRILYLTIAFRISECLITQLDVKLLLDDFYSKCTEQMKSELSRLPGDSLHAKVENLISSLKPVFCINGGLVKRAPGSDTWLKKSLNESFIQFLFDYTRTEKKPLEDLCRVLELIVGSTDIPWFGKVTPETMKTFVTMNKKKLQLENDLVFATTDLDTNLEIHSSKSCRKVVIDFFKDFLKSCAVKREDLSMVLSRGNPELLAALEERKPEMILAILMRDESFKCESGMVMLKGFSASANPVSLIKAPPSLPSHPTESQSTSKDDCICRSGIVFSVGKSKATVWCSSSEVSKNILILATRSKTDISGVIRDNFCNALKEQDKVIFTTESVSYGGWTIDFAVKVKIVSEFALESCCLCDKKRVVGYFFRKAVISNGIPFSANNAYLWNCKGCVTNISDSCGTVRCTLHSSSDLYFFAYFNTHTWFIGCDLEKGSSGEEYISIGDQVEVDICLLNFQSSGFSSWLCLCLRKESSQETSVFWNCAGRVVNKNINYVSIQVDFSPRRNISEHSFLVVNSQHIFIARDGSVKIELTSDFLEVNDEVIFDVEIRNSYTPKFIRKCKRPAPTILYKPHSISTAIFDILKTEKPAFQNALNSFNKYTHAHTVNEINSIQETSLVGQCLQRSMINHLSTSSEIYNMKVKNNRRNVRNTESQTISTGPAFSSFIPT